MRDDFKSEETHPASIAGEVDDMALYNSKSTGLIKTIKDINTNYDILLKSSASSTNNINIRIFTDKGIVEISLDRSHHDENMIDEIRTGMMKVLADRLLQLRKELKVMTSAFYDTL